MKGVIDGLRQSLYDICGSSVSGWGNGTISGRTVSEVIDDLFVTPPKTRSKRLFEPGIEDGETIGATVGRCKANGANPPPLAFKR